MARHQESAIRCGSVSRPGSLLKAPLPPPDACNTPLYAIPNFEVARPVAIFGGGRQARHRDRLEMQYQHPSRIPQRARTMHATRRSSPQIRGPLRRLTANDCTPVPIPYALSSGFAINVLIDTLRLFDARIFKIVNDVLNLTPLLMPFISVAVLRIQLTNYSFWLNVTEIGTIGNSSKSTPISRQCHKTP